MYFLQLWWLEVQGQVMAELVSSEASLLALSMAILSLGLHTALLLCVSGS